MSCYGCGVISYYLNDYGQQPSSGSNYHTPEHWNGTVKLYYYVQKQETRSEQVFSQSAYDSYLSSAQRQIDRVQQQINAENRHLALIKQQEQEQQIAKQKIDQEQKEITAKIISMGMYEKTKLLTEIFDKKDSTSQFTIEKIKSIGGLSVGILANIAIQKNHEELFNLSIEHGVTFAGVDPQGKTLVQLAIHSKNESFWNVTERAVITDRDLIVMWSRFSKACSSVQ